MITSDVTVYSTFRSQVTQNDKKSTKVCITDICFVIKKGQ